MKLISFISSNDNHFKDFKRKNWIWSCDFNLTAITRMKSYSCAYGTNNDNKKVNWKGEMEITFKVLHFLCIVSSYEFIFIPFFFLNFMSFFFRAVLPQVSRMFIFEFKLTFGFQAERATFEQAKDFFRCVWIKFMVELFGFRMKHETQMLTLRTAWNEQRHVPMPKRNKLEIRIGECLIIIMNMLCQYCNAYYHYYKLDERMQTLEQGPGLPNINKKMLQGENSFSTVVI